MSYSLSHFNSLCVHFNSCFDPFVLITSNLDATHADAFSLDLFSLHDTLDTLDILDTLDALRMKTPSIVALAATAVALLTTAPHTQALTTDHAGLSSSELRTWTSFVEYAIEYEKEYRSLDNTHDLVQRRYAAFADNLDRIHAHNALAAKGEYSFELGVNRTS